MQKSPHVKPLLKKPAAPAIEDSEDEPEVLEVPDVMTVDSDDLDEEPEVIKLEVPDVKTDEEELCL